MARKYRLNNRMLRNIRKNDEVYQAIVTDLKLLGKISAEEAKKLLRCEVPAYVSLDNNAVAADASSFCSCLCILFLTNDTIGF